MEETKSEAVCGQGHEQREKRREEVISSNKLFPMNYSHRSNLTVIPTFQASLQGLTIVQLCQFLDFDISRNKISECS